eukprot:TRINITY_DN43275_c0_g1_i1.p1 TRINITY_DN43275_c0_g1~~TRINITY_DN43275_c0_g1_i1.p1  ORF type:complete len:392 (+),score=35.82 TRINITY_DN43275_c0_g1_i1:26-1177(+)
MSGGIMRLLAPTSTKRAQQATFASLRWQFVGLPCLGCARLASDAYTNQATSTAFLVAHVSFVWISQCAWVTFMWQDREWTSRTHCILVHLPLVLALSNLIFVAPFLLDGWASLWTVCMCALFLAVILQRMYQNLFLTASCSGFGLLPSLLCGLRLVDEPVGRADTTELIVRVSLCAVATIFLGSITLYNSWFKRCSSTRPPDMKMAANKAAQGAPQQAQPAPLPAKPTAVGPPQQAQVVGAAQVPAPPMKAGQLQPPGPPPKAHAQQTVGAAQPPTSAPSVAGAAPLRRAYRLGTPKGLAIPIAHGQAAGGAIQIPAPAKHAAGTARHHLHTSVGGSPPAAPAQPAVATAPVPVAAKHAAGAAPPPPQAGAPVTGASPSAPAH